MKFDQLMLDLTKKEILGKVLACMVSSILLALLVSSFFYLNFILIVSFVFGRPVYN